MVANENFNLNLNNDDEEFVVEFGETTNLGGGGGGTSNFNELTNRPKYNNVTMTGATNIPKVPTKTSDLANTSDYQTGNQVDAAISTAISGKQDKLIAGSNISIANNTISATDTKYSAGTGLSLTGTQFSVNTNTIATKQDITNEATTRENADINLQGQIDAISASSDVTDIVGTYAELQAYDTTHLKDNDIIKVLQDESKDGETTYYRWSTTTQNFTLIGEEGPYYTKSATDLLLADKQDKLTAGSNIAIAPDNTISATDTTYTAGTNVQISSGNVISATDTTYSAGNGLSLNGTAFSVDTTTIQPKLTAGSNITIDSNNEISATDTTYSNFVGTDGTSAGTAGLVPAPATTDAGKFLKADGTWDTAGGGGSATLYNTIIGQNTDGAPTQKAVCDAFYADGATGSKIAIIGASGSTTAGNYSVTLCPNGTSVTGDNAIAIGRGNVYADYAGAIAIGSTAQARVASGIAIGNAAKVGSNSTGSVSIGREAGKSSGIRYSVSLGAYSAASVQGEVNIGMVNDFTTSGYNGTAYRILTGLHDGIDNHSAATVAQGNTLATSAPTTSTVGVLGQLYTDTTNMHTYQCTAISGDTYTWTQRW